LITGLHVFILPQEKLCKTYFTSADSITPEKDTYIASAIKPFGLTFSRAPFSLAIKF